jgi:hypothetical protein
MKKIYSAMALAIVVGLSANAEKKEYVNMPAQSFSIDQIVSSANMASTITPVQNRVKANTSVKKADVLGYYEMFYGDMFSDSQYLSTSSYGITASDEDGYVNIYGFYYDLPVKAKLDEANGTLTISKQLAFHNTYYDMDIYFSTLHYDTDTKTLKEVDSIVLTYEPDGVAFNSGELVFAPAWSSDVYDIIAMIYEMKSDGSFSGWMGQNYHTMVPFDTYMETVGYENCNIFEYKHWEWNTVGYSNFTDGFVAPAWDTTVAAYQVETQVNAADPNLILLKNPYGKGTPWEDVNDNTSKDGAIIFNIKNPDSVTIVPFVYSGLSTPIFFTNGLSEVFTANQETVWKYFYNLDEEDMETAYGMYNVEASVLDDNGVITIPTAFHSCQFDLETPGYWTEYETNDDGTQTEIEIPSQTIVELCDAALNSVEGIISDSASAPVRYYNLQGVEVANPAQGDLVIAKKGAKATKYIVK